MPTVPEGYTIELISSSDENVITKDRKINLSSKEQTTKLIFKVTSTSNNSTASTGEIEVKVPALKIPSSSGSSGYVPTYTVPTNLTATYGEHLSDIKLPEGFTFMDADLSVGNVGKNEFKLRYTPNVEGVYGYISNIPVTIEVKKAENTLSGDLKIEDIVYGEKINTPNITAKEGTVKFLYSKEENGNFTETVPTEVGTYYVKAVSEETDNLTKVESDTVKFSIKEKSDENSNEDVELDKVELKDDFTFSRIKPTSSYIKGTCLEGATVTILNSKNEQLSQTTVNSDGTYKVEIPKQKLYTKLTIKISKKGYDIYKKTTTVLYTFKKSLTVNSLNNKSTKVTGKGQVGAYVRVYNKEGKQIGKVAKVNKYGKYQITIPKQKKNAKLTIKMSKKATQSLYKTIIVK